MPSHSKAVYFYASLREGGGFCKEKDGSSHRHTHQKDIPEFLRAVGEIDGFLV